MTAAFVTPFGNQAYCLPTLPFPATDFADPWFQSSTAELPLELQGFTISLRDVTLSGAFAPDGERIDAMALTATLDVRDVEPFLVDVDLCALVAELDRPCFACPDGEEACVKVTVEDLDVQWDPEATLIERTPKDIAEDDFCVGYPA